MKFLFLSKYGDGLGLAQRIVDEGHSVTMYIVDTSYKSAGLGIVDRVGSWRPSLAESDIVICDMVGFGKHEKMFRRMNKPLFSCSRVLEQAELDRERGIELFKKAGINVPFTITYNNPMEAKELENTWETGYVIKPHDNASTAKTLVVRDKAAWDWALSLYAGTITVQRIVEDGIEVSTEGWFNGRGFIKPFNHTFEEKRLISQTSGSNTGCMGNVVINAKDGNKLTSETVMKLEPILKKIAYKGPIDINAIVTKDAVHALEFTSRLGYDAIEALMEGLNEPISDVIFETAVGVKKEMALGSDPMIAVRLSKSPWPITDPSSDDFGMPILGIDDSNRKHIFLTDAYKENDGIFYAASDGVIAKVTAHAKTVADARTRVYRTIDSINYPDKQYRLDIGERVPEDMKKLKEWNWL